MARGLLMVRATLRDAADRDAFDRWYEREHLPDAHRAFGADCAWRCWSRTDPTVHVAFYEFPSIEAVEAIQGSAALATLVAEFDRVWGPRVSRTREILALAGRS